MSEIGDIRTIACDDCNGDGMFYAITGRDQNGPVWRWTPCRACDGTGLQSVKFEELTLKDLDHG